MKQLFFITACCVSFALVLAICDKEKAKQCMETAKADLTAAKNNGTFCNNTVSVSDEFDDCKAMYYKDCDVSFTSFKMKSYELGLDAAEKACKLFSSATPTTASVFVTLAVALLVTLRIS